MTTNRHARARLLMVAVLCAAWPLAVAAQTSGTLRGRVIDLKGGPLIGATVLLTSSSQAIGHRSAVTDAAGTFQIASLPPGRDYAIRASFPEFATVILSEINVVSGQVRELTIIMQPKTNFRDRVEVHATPGVINLGDNTTQTRFSAEFIDAMPIFGQNYQDILTLAPGVTDVNGDGNPNIHGARDTDVITLVDGISTDDPLTGKVGVQLNIESIQEIEVKTSGATAEFGRAQGGFVNIVTKSGGNDFQGAFKFFWRGSTLDGDGAGIDDPELHGGVGAVGLRELEFNDFMPFVSVAGPIVKDHAWFFATLEYIQIEEPVNALSAAFVRGVKEHRGFAKLTWQASPNHRTVLSVNYDPQEHQNLGLNSFTREETGFTLEQGGLLLTLRGVSVLSPTVALETALAHFDGNPDLTPNLGADINGNGTLYFDRNNDGFFDARERDSGEDLDRDGAFDVWEDTFFENGVIDFIEVADPNCPAGQVCTVTISEDQDGDGRLTFPGACEGDLREDIDCDGFLDDRNEDTNGNGRLDQGEDIDGDRRLDFGTEDRNGNGMLDDTPFPAGLYPYGRLKPLVPDRDYVIQQSRGIVSGPYFETYADQRKRLTLRQDLSLFVPDWRGSHDIKMGYVVERDSFDRRTDARGILLERDEIPPDCFPTDTGTVCIGGQPPTVVGLLPSEPSISADATGRNVGIYVQNTYKPRPNLSIGLGLRFERESADTSGYSTFDPRLEAASQNRILALTGIERGGGQRYHPWEWGRDSEPGRDVRSDIL